MAACFPPSEVLESFAAVSPSLGAAGDRGTPVIGIEVVLSRSLPVTFTAGGRIPTAKSKPPGGLGARGMNETEAGSEHVPKLPKKVSRLL